MSDPTTLAELRQEIDRVDREIAAHLADRLRLSRAAAALRIAQTGEPIDAKRESEIRNGYERAAPGSVFVAAQILEWCRYERENPRR